MIELLKNYKSPSKRGAIQIPMIPYKQLSLADIFQIAKKNLKNNKPAFLSVLETHIDMDKIIPISFRNHFYASTGRTRKYPLQAYLAILLKKKELSTMTSLKSRSIPSFVGLIL